MAGFSGKDQIRICCQYMAAHGGQAEMPELYQAVEQHMRGDSLSPQGKSSLRFFINEVAVNDGYIHPHDPLHPGWRLTEDGWRLAGRRPPGPTGLSAASGAARTPDPLARRVLELASILARHAGEIGPALGTPVDEFQAAVKACSALEEGGWEFHLKSVRTTLGADSGRLELALSVTIG
jgi:hypothetical protein